MAGTFKTGKSAEIGSKSQYRPLTTSHAGYCLEYPEHKCLWEKIILLGHKPKKVGGLRVDRAETPENCLEKG